MNINDFLNKPIHIDIREYENLIRTRDSLKRKIGKVCNDIFEAQDKLDVLIDEKGNARYNSCTTKLENLNLKKSFYLEELS